MDIGGSIAATGVVIFLVSFVFCGLFGMPPKQVLMQRFFAALILVSLIVIPAGILIKIWA